LVKVGSLLLKKLEWVSANRSGSFSQPKESKKLLTPAGGTLYSGWAGGGVFLSSISALGDTDLVMMWRIVNLHGDPASPSKVVKIVANQHVMISHQYVEAISTTK
jgi:hypothetical protein